ncbi:MAG: hypothetical protein EYC62_04425, partial [Alphaproteobacteria bacterium]
MTVNSNQAASIALRSLQRSQNAMERALTRLSTGQNAPSARYDVAGVAVSSRIRGEIVALQKYQQNAQQAVSMMQIAEGTYQRGQEMLTRMRSLSAQAQSSNLSQVERGMLDTEYQQIKEEITRLAVSSSFGGTLLMDVGNMSFDFAGLRSYTVSNGATANGSSQLVDFNGDGILDVLLFNSLAGNVTVAYGHGDGSFDNEVVLTATGLSSPTSTVGDFDGDGRMDFSTYNGATITIWRNNGDGTVSSMNSFALGAVPAMVAGDINGDGMADFVTRSGANITVYTATGGGNFSTTSYTAGITASNIALADMNNDGTLDLILNSATQVQIMSSNSTGGYSNGSLFTTGANTFNARAAIADFDGDGFLDVIYGKTGGNIEIIRNLGNGNVGTGVTINVGSATAIGNVCVSDMNGDGILDLFTSSTVNSSVYWMQGTGSFTFGAAQTTSIAGTFNVNIIYGDLNNDGRVDILNRKQLSMQSILNNSTSGLESTIRVSSGIATSDNIGFRIGAMRLNMLAQGLEFSMINSIGGAKRAEQMIKAALNQLILFRTSVGSTINRLEKVQDNISSMVENQEGARSSIAD